MFIHNICMCIYVYIYIYIPRGPFGTIKWYRSYFRILFSVVLVLYSVICTIDFGVFVVVGVIDMLFICTCVLSHATPMPNHIGANMMFELSCYVL